MATYAKQLDNGRYEYGVVQYSNDRRKDRLVKRGEAGSYDEAMRAIRTIATEPA